MEAQIKLAQNLIQQGRKKEAAHHLKEAIRVNPHDYRLWVLLSTISTPESKKICLRRAKQLAEKAKAETLPLSAVNQPPRQPSMPPVTRVASAAPAIQATPIPVSRPLIKKPAQSAPTTKPPSTTSTQTQPKRRRSLWSISVMGLLLALIGVGLFQFLPSGQIRSAEAPLIPGEPAEIAQVPALIEASAQELEPNIADPEPANRGGDDADSKEIANEPSGEAGITGEEQNQAQEEPTLQPTVTPTPSPTFSPIQGAQEISAKPISLSSEATRAPWTPTPIPTNTPSPTPTPVPTFVNDTYANNNWPLIEEGERWIDVNLTTQMLTAYEGKTPVMQSVISSGRPPYYTVTGQFRIYLRYPEQTMDGRRLGFDYVTPGVPHVQYFYRDFALHGAFWHENFGTPVSHGCVNLNLTDAEWLYNWAGYGTLVNVHY